jgi:hypothetical protein
VDKTLAVLLSHDSEDWYTPEVYLEVVREVLGGVIELDPASSEAANKTVKAARFFSKEDNGLAHEWNGAVFLNPPYGKVGSRSSQEIWTSKLIEEYELGNITAAVTLINFVPGYKWWSKLWDYPVCAVNHCIRFIPVSGQNAGSAKASSAFVYLGPEEDKFCTIFRVFGPTGRLTK